MKKSIEELERQNEILLEAINLLDQIIEVNKRKPSKELKKLTEDVIKIALARVKYGSKPCDS